jgi:hypothetical protein
MKEIAHVLVADYMHKDGKTYRVIEWVWKRT